MMGFYVCTQPDSELSLKSEWIAESPKCPSGHFIKESSIPTPPIVSTLEQSDIHKKHRVAVFTLQSAHTHALPYTVTNMDI